jgi:hypothetical protein
MHMKDPIQAEQIAAARYALIAPIVSRQTPLAPGELKRWLREAASRSYELPGGRQMKVSERTLERYLAAYRKGNWDALKPKTRPKARRNWMPRFCSKPSGCVRSDRHAAWSSSSSCSKRAARRLPGSLPQAPSPVICAKPA